MEKSERKAFQEMFEMLATKVYKNRPEPKGLIW
jgi:hypothetical protein